MTKTMGWLENLLIGVAERIRALIQRNNKNVDSYSDYDLCHRLLTGLGEASNIALSIDILQRWHGKEHQEKSDFLEMLASNFNPDSQRIQQAVKDYSPNDFMTLKELMSSIEPPRQELFRCLNMAPSGTASLVEIRSFLIDMLTEKPHFKIIDIDFQHLLGAWFNRGFLQLRCIDWNSPAAILEKLMLYEYVHPMKGWDDLRRRLANDRRCFAFFHPALPNEPLIFIEVALTKKVSNSIEVLINPQSEISDNNDAKVAVFYSINNTLKGLRGISFGNFLIKQVTRELKEEFPNIKTFATLSPIPQMRKGLEKLLDDEAVGTHLQELLCNLYLSLCLDETELVITNKNILPQLDELFNKNSKLADRILDIQAILKKIVLLYLIHCKHGARTFDAVAHFHLSNGASLNRINLMANNSSQGMQQSWGCMVNYNYDANKVVANHEAYACDGLISLSKALQNDYQEMGFV